MLTEEDYKIVCGDKDLAAYTQTSHENRKRAEELAKEEVCSYLRSRYDCAAIFGEKPETENNGEDGEDAGANNYSTENEPGNNDAEPTEPQPFRVKNPLLRQLLVTVSLFYMSRWIPSRIGGQARTDDYERATAYLQGVQSGKVVMDLPRYKESEGNTGKGTGRHIPMVAGGNESHRYNVW